MVTRSTKMLLGLAIGALSLSACSSGPGSEEDLVAALMRDDTFTQGEAECIAENVFLEYGEDEDALAKISGAASYEDLTGTEGVPGFDEAFSNILAGCANT
jgi:hypothetical protein